jgi:dipeptidyl aminopeptidase/acylaminoacyl peptidase
VATGEGHEFWRNPLDEPAFASISSIQWADGHVVFQAERDNWNHYYSVPISGTSQTPLELTPGEGVSEQMHFSQDGTLLYYASNIDDIDRRHIWQVPTRGGTPTRLTEGTGIETTPTPLASGERLALLSAGARQPQSVGLVSAPGGGVQIIAPKLPEDFPLDAQVVPEAVVLTAEDGVRFHAQLFVPDDKQPGERGPAIVFAHGGPRSQMYLGYHTSRFYHMAYAVNQYFAAQGYVVLSVNYRRGTGYGRAFRTAENAGSSGASEYRDIYAAGRYLQDRPDVDPRRIGIWGLSYGGILTSTALARNSDVFAAGVDIAGLHHWAGENPLSGRPFERPYDPASVAYASSAVADVDGAMSPILLIHGDDDRNVEFSQTTHLVQLLRAHGAYYELIVFPDDVHVFLLFDRWLKTFNAADDFFGRFLKDPAGKP